MGKFTRQNVLRAELLRTTIDAINHVLLYFANKAHFGQMYNLKKHVVFVPALLFIVFGVDTLHEVYHGIMHPQVDLPAAASWIPLLVC